MTAYFLKARQTVDEDTKEPPAIFEENRHKKENIIPPIGIADPELVQSFEENIGDEEKILRDIAEAEAYKRETPFETAKREVLGPVTRAAEGFLGGLGSWLNLLTPELYQDEEGMPYEPGKQPRGLPSSEELHEFTKEKTGKYLEPRSEFSKTIQEYAGDVGSMFAAPGLGKLAKFLLPLGGQITKQTIKSVGGTESQQELGKLGFMVLSSMANLGNGQRVAGKAMEEAREMIPSGLKFSAKPTEQAIKKIKTSDWFRSGATPSKAPAMAELERIEKHIQDGFIEGRMSMQLRKDINEARKKLSGFSFDPVPDKKAALKYLGEVDDALIAGMENYGNKVNPKWWNSYQRANEAFKVTQRSKQLADFIEQHAKPMQSQMAKTLFHIGGASAFLHSPALIGIASPVGATALATGKTIQIMNRMIKSPVLRNHYMDVLRAASTGNANVMNKALNKFDKEAVKHEPANPQH